MTHSEIQELEQITLQAESEISLAATRIDHIRSVALANRLRNLLNHVLEGQNTIQEPPTAPPVVFSTPQVQ